MILFLFSLQSCTVDPLAIGADFVVGLVEKVSMLVFLLPTQ